MLRPSSRSAGEIRPGSSAVIPRRSFLWRSGGGLGAIALASLLAEERGARAQDADSARGRTHHPPRARRVIQLFMAGAASHIDLFDHKPLLEREHGKPWDPGEKVELFQNGLGATLASPWSWTRYGASGKELSEVVAPLGASVDRMAFVHNLISSTGVHSQATFLQATGFDRPGFPGMGAWVSYALGSENENLPTFVVLPDERGYASNGPKNWGSAFLPGETQGTTIFPGRPTPIANLFSPPKSGLTSQIERATQSTLARLNREHRAAHTGDPRLDARMRSYELAARLQLAAPEALDISDEPEHILRLYGLDRTTRSYPAEINPLEETERFSRRCLIARRLVERGVRFVQIWSGNDNGFPRRNWDSHEDVERDHGPLARGMARGAAALLQDLEQRGLLEDTIVHWTTEFGRMPSSQGSKGRDHNPFCFTNWLAGGGVRGGIVHGESDEWGFKPLDRSHPTRVYDVHATMLHLLGLDHERLTVRHDGIDRRLTDVHGEVIRELLA